jgi:hypothetical protein
MYTASYPKRRSLYSPLWMPQISYLFRFFDFKPISTRVDYVSWSQMGDRNWNKYDFTLKEGKRYCKLKEEAQDRTLWRAQFGRGYGPVARQTTTWSWLYVDRILGHKTKLAGVIATQGNQFSVPGLDKNSRPHSHFGGNKLQFCMRQNNLYIIWRCDVRFTRSVWPSRLMVALLLLLSQ